MSNDSAWRQLEDALGFCSPKKHTGMQIRSTEEVVAAAPDDIGIVPKPEVFSGDIVRDQNERLLSGIRSRVIGGRTNLEKDNIWTVQGFLHDETVDCYPQKTMTDLLVKDCAGDKGWTTVIGHGSCRKLAIANCTQVRILCDHAMEEGLITQCNTVELVLGGHPPKLVLDKCRTVRLIMYRPQNTTPELECHDCVQIIYQSAAIESKGRATAQDVMRAPKFDPMVVRGDIGLGKADDGSTSTNEKDGKSGTVRASENPATKTSTAPFTPADIGVELIVTADKYLKISRVIPYGGAYMSGQVKSGDALHSVDGVPIYGKTVEEVQERLTGSAGTSVLVALQSPGPSGLQGMWRTVLVERVQLDASQRSRQAHLDLGFGITIVVNHNEEGEIAMIKPTSAAEATGRVTVGDIITEVEGEETPFADDVVRAMTTKPKPKMNLKIRKATGQVAAVALSKDVSQVTDLLGRQWCSVKHSYLPRQVDELELKAGDSVFVLEAAEDDGWYIAEKKGKRGLVPATHVVFHGHDAAPTATVRMAQATHTYTATNPDELSFKKGDVLPVMSEAEDPGWFVSRVDGRDGLVPSTHITFLTSSVPALPLERAQQPKPTKPEFNWSTAAGGAKDAANCWSCGLLCDGGTVFCPKCKAPVSLSGKDKRL